MTSVNICFWISDYLTFPFLNSTKKTLNIFFDNLRICIFQTTKEFLNNIEKKINKPLVISVNIYVSSLIYYKYLRFFNKLRLFIYFQSTKEFFSIKEKTREPRVTSVNISCLITWLPYIPSSNSTKEKNT